MARIITPSEFVALVNERGDISINDELEINGDVSLEASNFKCQIAAIENLTFHGSISISDITNVRGISFKNCKFKKRLLLRNIKASGYNPESKDYHSINISGSKFDTEVTILESSLERGIKFTDCRIAERLSISECDVSKGSIGIEESVIKVLDFSSLNIFGSGLRIDKSEINSYLRYLSINTSGGLSFLKSIFHGDFHLWGGTVSGVIFNDNKFHDDVKVAAIKNLQAFVISGDDFDKSLLLDYNDNTNKVEGSHETIYLEKGKFGVGFVVNGANNTSEKLTINCSLSLVGTIQFNSCFFERAEINYGNYKANLEFNVARFGQLRFDHFNNYGNLIFSSCKALDVLDSEFSVYNSNLGKAQFQNFFFNSFKKVTIIDSLVSNIEFSGMHWFDSKVLDAGDKESPWRRTREVFRQLKQASEKQNDKFQALEFQALELSAYRNEITQKGKLWSNDGWILWLGQSNDFGLNWRKPLWILLIATTILYFPLVISASNKILWLPACNFNDFKTTINEFANFSYLWPQLFNPARTLKHAFHEEAILNFGVYFWDAVQRIILAFLIVQIVSAFRKFFKS